jgi:type IX secretion system PorP/SprF family membrane protein
MKKNYFIYLFSFVTLVSMAQDIHFSQFWMQPLYLNPANAGLFDGQYRAGGIYRRQWRSVPVPYRTVSFMGDMRMKDFISKKTDAGIGLIFNNDVSGDSKYSINQLYVPLSAIKVSGSDSALELSGGISPGISNIAFNTAKLSFDSQWDGDIYNSSLSNQENFPTQSRTYFDVGAGVAMNYKIKQTGYISFGTSLSHINRPRVSFFKNNAVKLYAKSATSLSIKYPLSQLLYVNADFLYEKQGPFHETVAAARVGYFLDIKENISVNAGFSNRFGDAAILMLGMDYKNYKIGFAYDMNYSKFKAATNKRGAIEIGLIYIFKKEPPFIVKKRVCPIYM